MLEIFGHFCGILGWPALIPALIITGWGVTYWLMHRNLKSTEINNLISEKNQILDEIELLASKVWLAEQPNPKDESCILLPHKIESLRKKYRELADYSKFSENWNINIGKLRKTATFNHEKAGDMEEEEKQQRMKEISAKIKEFEKFPRKKF